MKELIARNGNMYMIIDRPGEKTIKDEFRMDDLCIIVHPNKGFRQPSLELQRALKFIPGWKDFEHNEAKMREFLKLPEKSLE